MDEERRQLLARVQPAWKQIGNFRALIYGPKGSGKTVKCAMTEDPVVLDVEDSKRSLLNHPETVNVKCFTVQHFNDMYDIGWAIRDKDLPCKTLIVDGFDKLADDTVTYLLNKAVAADNRRDPYAASQLEYRVRNELFKRLTADWVNLPCNLIFICHEEEVHDEVTGRVTIRPNLSGAVRDFMGGYVVVQGHLTAVEAEDPNKTKRFLQVHPSRRVDAKTRIGGLPRMIENPSIQDLIDKHYDGVKLAANQKGNGK